MKRNWIATLAAVLLVAGTSLARPEGLAEPPALITSTVNLCAHNPLTADVTGNEFLQYECSQGTQANTAYQHVWGVIASDTRHAAVKKFICYVGGTGGATSSGTLNLNLIATHDDLADAETIGTISYNLATQYDTVRQDTTFSTPTLSPPYWLAVRLADGGSVALATLSEIDCTVVWAW